MSTWLGKGWAQPVVDKRWAFICSALDAFKRATNYRFAWANHAMGYAHCRACGVPTAVDPAAPPA